MAVLACGGWLLTIAGETSAPSRARRVSPRLRREEITPRIRPDGSSCAGARTGTARRHRPRGHSLELRPGNWHTCGIKDDGAILCWEMTGKAQATPPGGIFTQLAAGSGTPAASGTRARSCAGDTTQAGRPLAGGIFTQHCRRGAAHLRHPDDGAILCWDPTSTARPLRPRVAFTRVAAGGSHTCGSRDDGSVVCWGNQRRRARPRRRGNSFNRGPAPSTTAASRSTIGPVLGANSSARGTRRRVHLRKLRSELVHCGLRTTDPFCAGEKLVRSGHAAGACIRADRGGQGTRLRHQDRRLDVCWGSDSYGQSRHQRNLHTGCGGSESHLRDPDRRFGRLLGRQRLRTGHAATGAFTQLAASSTHTCGLRPDGSIVCWGSDFAGQATAPAGTFTQVALEVGRLAA